MIKSYKEKYSDEEEAQSQAEHLTSLGYNVSIHVAEYIELWITRPEYIMRQIRRGERKTI
jgi:hypothetical protein